MNLDYCAATLWITGGVAGLLLGAWWWCRIWGHGEGKPAVARPWRVPRLQVSEFAKLGLVFCLAHYLAINQTRLGEFKRGYLYPLADRRLRRR